MDMGSLRGTIFETTLRCRVASKQEGSGLGALVTTFRHQHWVYVSKISTSK